VKPTLIVICGPTAVGKTRLSIALARTLDAEIISADSRQFYREMNIGTAKPDPEDLAAVPHHFINHLSIFNKHYSAGTYEAEVLEFLDSYFKHKRIALMVGGSGLFIRAVCSGFDKMEPKDDADFWTIRNFLHQQTLDWLQCEVQRLDPEYFALVDKKNPARLKRALEVIYSTGKKYSEQRIGKKAERPFNLIKIGLTLPKPVLHEKINHRVDEMMKRGLLDEAKELYTHKKLPALNTVGYTELFDYLEDKMSLDDAIELIKKNTRQYAKRQLTWFKKDEYISWFSPNQSEEIVTYIRKKL
jgi:tRNA dimethylallyltransferase